MFPVRHGKRWVDNVTWSYSVRWILLRVKPSVLKVILFVFRMSCKFFLFDLSFISLLFLFIWDCVYWIANAQNITKKSFSRLYVPWIYHEFMIGYIMDLFRLKIKFIYYEFFISCLKLMIRSSVLIPQSLKTILSI